MGVKEFDFSTGKTVNANRYQTVAFSDCAHTCGLIEEHVRKNRHKFLGCSADLRQALEWVRKFKRGLFFLDVDSNGVDPLPLMKLLAEKAPDFKVILMSKTPTKELLNQGQAAGGVGFLVKPLSINALDKVIERVK